MDSILDFLANNYLWFMISGAVLLIALIGFVVDGKKKKKVIESEEIQLPVEDTPVSTLTTAATLEQNAPSEAAAAPVQNTFDDTNANTEQVTNEPTLNFENTENIESSPVSFENIENENNGIVEIGQIGDQIVAEESIHVEPAIEAPTIEPSQEELVIENNIPVENPIFTEPLINEQTVANENKVEEPVVEEFNSETIPSVEIPTTEINEPVIETAFETGTTMNDNLVQTENPTIDEVKPTELETELNVEVPNIIEEPEVITENLEPVETVEEVIEPEVEDVNLELPIEENVVLEESPVEAITELGESTNEENTNM